LNDKLEADLTEDLIDGYQRAGEDVGYWATRFVQTLRRNGGLATARRMLKPRRPEERKGLDALLDAGRPDLTLEAVVLKEKYQTLFTAEELAVPFSAARRRLLRVIPKPLRSGNGLIPMNLSLDASTQRGRAGRFASMHMSEARKPERLASPNMARHAAFAA